MDRELDKTAALLSVTGQLVSLMHNLNAINKKEDNTEIKIILWDASELMFRTFSKVNEAVDSYFGNAGIKQ